MTGSNRDARRAGIQLTISATTISRAVTDRNDSGSVTATPYTRPRTTRDSASAPAIPASAPHITGRIESFTIMPNEARSGTSATRTPISFVRRETECDSTP